MGSSVKRTHPAAARAALFLIAFSVSISLGGCASSKYLPSSQNLIRSHWNTYDEIREAFDRIHPYQTDTAQLKELGFTPEVTPNVQVLSYLDIIQRFLPNQSITLKDLDNGLQDCLASRNHCQAYEIQVRHTDSERYGNVMLDLFNFHRRTTITGWEFKGLIVLKDDLTVYKLYSGKPKINEFRDSKNPLGPLQNSERILWEVAE